MQSTSQSYPATFTFDPPERVANWWPLVHWLVAIPHWVVLYGLGIASQAVNIVSWFVILFTGRLPEGLANFQAMCLRYTARIYIYAAFMREEYPPFGFAMTSADPGDDLRVRLDVSPELENRNRLTTFFRLILAIPHLIVLILLSIGAMVVVIIGFFAVLVTGRWPDGLRNFLLGVGRWSLRLNAYVLLLTDTYPPFGLD